MLLCLLGAYLLVFFMMFSLLLLCIYKQAVPFEAHTVNVEGGLPAFAVVEVAQVNGGIVPCNDTIIVWVWGWFIHFFS
jgi:hypothetical protein